MASKSKGFTEHPAVNIPKSKTLKDLINEVAKKFDRLERMITAIGDKKINGLAVFGERGVGKSKSIIDMLDKFKGDRNIKKIKGKISPLQVYTMLYENQDSDCIVWFDDCDSAFTDTDAMNILKAAMDSDEPRDVMWQSSSKLVPVPEFRFRGRVIVSTNIRLSKSEHLAAFLDRMHWCSIFLSEEEKLIRIEQVAPIMANTLSISEELKDDIIQWIKDNLKKIGKLLSLRTFRKVADLAKFAPDWRELAMTMIDEQKEVDDVDEETISVKDIDDAMSGKKIKKGKKVKVTPGDHTKKKGNEGNYKSGSMIGVIYESLQMGKTLSFNSLEKKFGGKRSAINNSVERLERHGKRSGKWILVRSGDNISFK